MNATESSKKTNGKKAKTTDWDVTVAASATADAAAKVEAVEAKTFTIDLPVKLTDAERVTASTANGIRRRELDARKAACKAVADDIRADEKKLHGDVLLQEQGEALRPVLCKEQIIFEQNTAQTVRLDTGEIVADQTRALDFDELQPALFNDGEDSSLPALSAADDDGDA